MLLLLTALPPKPIPSREMWTNHENQIAQPLFSCYQLQNETWNCAEDARLNRDIDFEDSY